MSVHMYVCIKTSTHLCQIIIISLKKGPQKENNAMDSIRTTSVQQGMKIILALIMPLLLASCSCSSGHDSSESTPEPPASPTSMLVALSFDDGPSSPTTPKVLDVLEDVPASFFVIGQNINDSSAEWAARIGKPTAPHRPDSKI